MKTKTQENENTGSKKRWKKEKLKSEIRWKKEQLKYEKLKYENRCKKFENQKLLIKGSLKGKIRKENLKGKI
ncbi:hypothetical protein [Methanosarcina barkeri]|uniref:Uncharacterized protein n=1 Tax=Methanosarcina barkeri 227 TaxID=1434106 RepID=A0A0E3R4X3_METBA|nr:hypothetical protein [Methanosarcina barkeri]AKB58724.1 hypothetical protein MSBR2_2208 [Methanosarcina barkeri 227]